MKQIDEVRHINKLILFDIVPVSLGVAHIHSSNLYLQKRYIMCLKDTYFAHCEKYLPKSTHPLLCLKKRTVILSNEVNSQRVHI